MDPQLARSSLAQSPIGWGICLDTAALAAAEQCPIPAPSLVTMEMASLQGSGPVGDGLRSRVLSVGTVKSGTR